MEIVATAATVAFLKDILFIYIFYHNLKMMSKIILIFPI